MKEKNLELERMVFFCDAVVAIAITLLALDLKVTATIPAHLTFSDIGESWQDFLAFLLSFFYIAIFWTVHHQFFHYIKGIDRTLLWYNLGWLLFIVLLPFSTSLISVNLFNTPAMCCYATNTFLITFFQNQIWNYVSSKPHHMKDDIDKNVIRNARQMCNVAMINALLAIVVSFFYPLIAFIILTLRLPMINIAGMFSQRGIKTLIKRRSKG